MVKVYVAYFCAVFKHIQSFSQQMSAERRTELAANWIQEQISDGTSKNFWTAIEREMREIIAQLPSEITYTNYSKYFTELESFVSKCWKSTTACLEGSQRISDYEVKSQLLFVFDEARILNETNGDIKSNFERLRYAMMTLPLHGDGGRTFCIFTDTTSRISNFSPPRHLDHSFRRKEIVSPIH
jgi:hypothetical protein